MDVNFDYKEKIVYKDGTLKIYDKVGVYSNVEFFNAKVQVVGKWEDI